MAKSGSVAGGYYVEFLGEAQDFLSTLQRVLAEFDVGVKEMNRIALEGTRAVTSQIAVMLENTREQSRAFVSEISGMGRVGVEPGGMGEALKQPLPNPFQDFQIKAQQNITQVTNYLTGAAQTWSQILRGMYAELERFSGFRIRIEGLELLDQKFAGVGKGLKDLRKETIASLNAIVVGSEVAAKQVNEVSENFKKLDETVKKGKKGFAEWVSFNLKWFATWRLFWMFWKQWQQAWKELTEIMHGTSLALRTAVNDLTNWEEIQRRGMQIQREAIAWYSRHISTITDYTDVVYKLTTSGQREMDRQEIHNRILKTSIALNEEAGKIAEIVAATYRIYGDTMDWVGGAIEKVNHITAVMGNTFRESVIEGKDFTEGMKYLMTQGRLTEVAFEVLLAALGVVNNAFIRGGMAGRNLASALIDIIKHYDKFVEMTGVAYDPDKPLPFIQAVNAIRTAILSTGAETEKTSKASALLSEEYGEMAKGVQDMNIRLEEYRKLVEVVGARGARAILILVTQYDKWKELSLSNILANDRIIDQLVEIREKNPAAQMTILAHSLRSLFHEVLLAATGSDTFATSLRSVSERLIRLQPLARAVGQLLGHISGFFLGLEMLLKNISFYAEIAGNAVMGLFYSLSALRTLDLKKAMEELKQVSEFAKKKNQEFIKWVDEVTGRSKKASAEYTDFARKEAEEFAAEVRKQFEEAVKAIEGLLGPDAQKARDEKIAALREQLEKRLVRTTEQGLSERIKLLKIEFREYLKYEELKAEATKAFIQAKEGLIAEALEKLADQAERIELRVIRDTTTKLGRELNRLAVDALKLKQIREGLNEVLQWAKGEQKKATEALLAEINRLAEAIPAEHRRIVQDWIDEQTEALDDLGEKFKEKVAEIQRAGDISPLYRTMVRETEMERIWRKHDELAAEIQDAYEKRLKAVADETSLTEEEKTDLILRAERERDEAIDEIQKSRAEASKKYREEDFEHQVEMNRRKRENEKELTGKIGTYWKDLWAGLKRGREEALEGERSYAVQMKDLFVSTVESMTDAFEKLGENMLDDQRRIVSSLKQFWVDLRDAFTKEVRRMIAEWIVYDLLLKGTAELLGTLKGEKQSKTAQVLASVASLLQRTGQGGAGATQGLGAMGTTAAGEYGLGPAGYVPPGGEFYRGPSPKPLNVHIVNTIDRGTIEGIFAGRDDIIVNKVASDIANRGPTYKMVQAVAREEKG